MKYIVAGISLGLLFGAALGAALQHVAVGVSLGVSLGVAGGMIFSAGSSTAVARKKAASDKQPLPHPLGL